MDADNKGAAAWVILLIGVCLLPVAPVFGVLAILAFGVMLGRTLQKPPP